MYCKGMRLTKNTNKATRNWVDSVLSNLDLVLSEYSYRDCLETIKINQICNVSRSEVIEALTANGGCITKQQHEHNMKPKGGYDLAIMAFIETL